MTLLLTPDPRVALMKMRMASIMTRVMELARSNDDDVDDNEIGDEEINDL